MKAVVQRVSRAGATPGGEIGAGLCVLRASPGDTAADADRLAGKIAQLRIFENDEGKFDRSLLDTGGAALVVSQFTLLADTAKREPPELHRRAALERQNRSTKPSAPPFRVTSEVRQTGVFGARMALELVNDGPVTIVLDT